LKLSKLT